MNDFRSQSIGLWPGNKATTKLNKKQRGTGTKIMVRRVGLKWKWILQDSMGNTLRYGLAPVSKKAYSEAQEARTQERAKWADLAA